jgi:deoxyribodipyrimidine photo-lyase
MKAEVNIFWFRRDLRLTDNTALFHALNSGIPVVPIFIFDTYILDDLEDKTDARVNFIHASVQNLQQQLIAAGASLEVYYGKPISVFETLLEKYSIKTLFTNHDYEPYAQNRDAAVEALLAKNGAIMHTYKDQVIFEKNEVLKDDGKPYTVFTPYSKKWKACLQQNTFHQYKSETLLHAFYKQTPQTLPTLEEIGFCKTNIPFPTKETDTSIIKQYALQRNFPSLKNGTSKLGIHLRFGTISIRALARESIILSETFLNELIWRDFYHMILWHFPHIAHGKAFRAEYDLIPWRNEEILFQKWCEGKTGYPIVDAGMRELNATGFMHNRVRMITASFLTKHLLIDWRWGEAYFAKKLLDFDFAANNGGWQWAAGSGCDAAPYFRVFNPTLQTEKFDKQLIYINKWVPELNSFNYPKPIVNHELARKRAIEVYSSVLKKQ